MKISLGNFGQLQAQTTPIQINSSGDQMALQQIGAGIQEKFRQQEELDRAENAKFLANYGNAIQDISVGLTQDVRSGKLRADEYSKAFSDRAKEWREKELLTIPGRQKKSLTPALELYGIESQGKAASAQDSLVKEQRQATDETTMNALLKQSQMDPEGAIQQGMLVIENNPNWSSQEKAEIGLNFADKARFSNRDLWIESQENIGVLRKERKALLDGQYKELNPQSRRTLVERAEQRISELDANIRNQRNAEESASFKTAKDITDAKMKGFYVSPESDLQLNNALKQYKDKPWAKELTAANSDVSAMRNMALRPIQTQGMMVAEAKAEVAKAGPNEVGAAVDKYERLQNAWQRNVKAANENPWGYYQGVYGDKKMPAPLVIDETLPQQISDRVYYTQLVESSIGVNPGAFTPIEAQKMTQFIDALPVEQRLGILSEISRMDTRTAAATFDSLGKEKPVYAMAGKINMYGGKLNNRPVGDLMLKGQIALDSKSVQVSDKSNLDTAISEEIGQIFSDSPGEYAQAKDAVKWTLAGLYSSRGEYKIDVVKSGDLLQAVKAVINPSNKINGRRVSVPVNMDIEEFDDKIKTRMQEAINKSDIADENKPYTLDNASIKDAPGDGNYWLVWSDGNLVFDKNKRPIPVAL